MNGEKDNEEIESTLDTSRLYLQEISISSSTKERIILYSYAASTFVLHVRHPLSIEAIKSEDETDSTES